MKQISIIMKYTFNDAVKKKAFKISTLIIVLLIAIVCALPRIISSFSKDDAGGSEAPGTAVTVTEKCYYIDSDNLIPGGAEALKTYLPQANVIAGDISKISDYENEVHNDDSAYIVNVVKKGDNTQPGIEITAKSFMSSISGDNISRALSETYAKNILSDKGIDSDTVALARTQLSYDMKSAGSMNISGYVMGIVLTLLMFFAIYYYGYGVAMSIATEKTSRVMETLVVSAKPSNILIGKCIGMGLVGLFQFVIILVSGLVFYNLLIPGDFMLMGMPLSLDAFNYKSVILVAVYFILGYALYAVLNAVCGASVSKIEDLNSAMMPVMLVAILSFYLGYFTAISGAASSMLQKVAMYVPFCSPFILPFKVLNGDVPVLDITISIALLIVAIIVVTMISIRIYSASVLHYGKRMKWKDLYNTKV